MSDQGAGGGIESGHVSTHSRSKSDNEPVPTEATGETRQPSPKQADEAKFAQTSQNLPRNFNGRQTATPPVQNGLSRNPPSASPDPAATLRYRDSSYFARRPLEPPVTKTTLSELDVTKIIHNPKLRHDINFDPELHFRPNLDGEKGRRKQEKANQFWNTLKDQLVQFVTDREGFGREHPSGDDWCLPALLKAVKEIIQTLVPQRDRDLLNEGLNVELLMQQFNTGTLDLEKLAAWLAGVLKLHCAPMRDEWVDEMYQELSSGNRNDDVDEIVKGMRSLLSVLEAMKLDVANHQIRCLRPVLIEDTVHFEQRFFHKKIASGKLDISPARAWYDEAARCYAGLAPYEEHMSGETAVFFEALSQLVMPSTDSARVPHTLVFDEERLVKLRSDMLDAINLEICMRLYDDLARTSRIHSFASSPPPAPSVPSYVADDERAPARGSGLEFNFNTPPSRPSSLALSACGSDGSSPRSSGLICLQPPADPADAKAKARELYSSLLALLHTAPPSSSAAQRWEGLVQALALQVFRFTSMPQDMLPVVETRLAASICDPQDERHREVEDQLHARLLAELAKRVRDFRGLTGVGLFSVATGGRIPSPGKTWDGPRTENPRERELLDLREAREQGGIEDMATRLAHLGILHWRVWAQLAYVGDADETCNVDVAADD